MKLFLLDAAASGTAAPAPTGAAVFMNMAFPILMVFVVIYFFMIRPQSKRQKDELKMRESLKKGDRIVTIGGINGFIIALEENHIYIEVDKDVKLKMAREAIRPAPENEPAK